MAAHDPIAQELHDWLHSDDPAEVAHGQAVLALNDLDQSLDDFRTRCTLVPMKLLFGAWDLADETAAGRAKVRDQIMNPKGLAEEERTQQFHALLDHIDEIFSSTEQPLMPVMSLHAAKWVLFYKASIFTEGGKMAHPNAVNGVGLYHASEVSEVMSILNHMASKGDPVEWYFNHLKKHSKQSR